MAQAGSARHGGQRGRRKEEKTSSPPTLIVASTAQDVLEKNTVALQKTAKVLQNQPQGLEMATKANVDDMKT